MRRGLSVLVALVVSVVGATAAQAATTAPGAPGAQSYFDLQTRDMTYTSWPSRSGMSCTVVARSATHNYAITTTYVADPRRDAVLMKVSFDGPHADRVYVRLDPLAGGTGGGGCENAGGSRATLVSDRGATIPVASNTNTTTQATNRDYAVPTFEALQASTGFGDASVPRPPARTSCGPSLPVAPWQVTHRLA